MDIITKEVLLNKQHIINNNIKVTSSKIINFNIKIFSFQRKKLKKFKINRKYSIRTKLCKEECKCLNTKLCCDSINWRMKLIIILYLISIIIFNILMIILKIIKIKIIILIYNYKHKIYKKKINQIMLITTKMTSNKEYH